MSVRSARQVLIAALGVSISATSLFGQQKKVQPSFGITGVVLNARDNAPVLRCSITAQLVGGGRGGSREPVFGETDDRGRFALSLPSVGNWELMASAHAIRSQPLDSHDGYFTGIILTAQSPSYEVIFRAVPDAILTGVVTDEAGEAVRNAQVAVFSMNPAARQTGDVAMQQRQGTQTDDRGHYEISGLDPGNYMVEVQARPWYASSNNGAGRIPATATSVTLPDPSLDVVYPSTWYPGVTDASAAGVLIAHPGDALQADFRLLPLPSAHLLVPSPTPPPSPAGRPGVQIGGPGFQSPNISLILPNGGLQQVFGQVARTASGDLDISGLAPGNYQVSVPGSGSESSNRTSIVRVQSGSTIGLNSAVTESAVSIAVDGGTGADPSQIVLVDRVTGQSFSPFERPGGGGRPPGLQPSQAQDRRGSAAGGLRGQPGGAPTPGAGGRGRSRSSGGGEEVTLQVPPGQYEVTVRGESAVFIIGLTAKGASVAGRSVNIPEGEVHLVVHLAAGFATLNGTALFEGKPSVGAMVLLVPATLGNPASLTVVRRDQTNSDGSYRLENVIPGQYILLAIDHGWAVRWADPATLRPYLMQGVPLDLRPLVTVNQKLTALTP